MNRVGLKQAVELCKTSFKCILGYLEILLKRKPFLKVAHAIARRNGSKLILLEDLLHLLPMHISIGTNPIKLQLSVLYKNHYRTFHR